MKYISRPTFLRVFFVRSTAASTTWWMRNDHQSGRGQGHVTCFLNFGTLDTITFKRMKLDSSFFLCWIGHGKYYIRDDE